MDLHTLRCKNCGAPLKLASLDFQNNYIKCEYCGSIQVIEKDDASKITEPVVLPVSSMIHHIEGSNYLFIDIPPKGFKPSVIPLLIFTLLWNGFMIVWNVLGIVTGAYIMILFGLIHDTVGIFLLGALVFQIFGKESIKLDPKGLSRIIITPLYRNTKMIPLTQVYDIALTNRKSSRPSFGSTLYAECKGKKLKLAYNTMEEERKWIKYKLKNLLMTLKL